LLRFVYVYLCQIAPLRGINMCWYADEMLVLFVFVCWCVYCVDVSLRRHLIPCRVDVLASRCGTLMCWWVTVPCTDLSMCRTVSVDDSLSMSWCDRFKYEGGCHCVDVWLCW
jgi:hypothetical protein